MKTCNRLIICLFLLVPASFAACKKENSDNSPAAAMAFSGVVAASDARALWVFDDLFNNALGVNTEVGFGGTGIFDRPANTTDCFQVTITQVNTSARFPLQVTIDFGTGCTGRDNRIRKGKINIIYTGNVGVAGNSATVTFNNYYIDGLLVEGTLDISNTTMQTAKSFKVKVQDARISTNRDNYIQWNSEKNIVQTEGMTTPVINLDDVFSISGMSNGSALIGDQYLQWSTNTTTPLMKKFACPWFSKGTLSLMRKNAEVATLDYGAGTCDRQASFTLNGSVHEITLH